MTGHLPSTTNKHRWDYGPSLQAIVIVFVALFILFLWLDFIQTQQIESTGRDIQVKTEELGVLERQRDALLREISAAGSQQRMSDQAWMLGYRPQIPIYLPVAQPLVQATGEATSNSWPLATPESAEGAMAETSSSLWDLLTQQFRNVELEAIP